MAEYYISYEQINEYIEDLFNQCDSDSMIKDYKAEILAAITSCYGIDKESTNEMIDLWNNCNDGRSQLVLKNKYILVQQSMLDMFKCVCTSGLIDAIILSVIDNNVLGFSVSVGTSIVFAIVDLLKSIKELNDWDFCVYLQVVKNSSVGATFTKRDLSYWLPDNESCNIPEEDRKYWECCYMNKDDGVCEMKKDQHIETALDSLEGKQLLKSEITDKGKIYKFKK